MNPAHAGFFYTLYMLVLLSPAKRLNEQNEPMLLDQSNIPFFFDEAVKVNSSLKRLSAKKLAELQNISSELASLNRTRNQLWNSRPEEKVYHRAVYLFNGDAYLGLNAESLDSETLDYAQDHLRILSGLYGLLKPLDLIEPYRLEMGTQLKVRRSENLYAFWKAKLTKKIKDDFANQVIINLASKEYSTSIDFKKIKNRVISVEFKDRNAKGEYKVMSFYAKKARGLMTRFILQNRIEDPKELVGFTVDNYQYSINESAEDKLVFLRDH